MAAEESNVHGAVVSEEDFTVSPMFSPTMNDAVADDAGQHVEGDIEMRRPPVAALLVESDSDTDSEPDDPSSPVDPAMKEKEQKTLKLRNRILVVLFTVGLIAGVFNGGLVQWAISELSKAQAKVLMGTPAGPFYFMLTTGALAALSAYIIKLSGEPGATGTGMAEVKALMVSDFHPTEFPKLVSVKIMVVRFLSLICAAGAGLSVGLAAPMTHCTVCFAYSMMKFIPDFGELIDNPAMLKQIFAAAAAVGFTSVSNTPLGGLLFSIEVTSAYYLISNYWRSFMAVTAGALVYDLIVQVRQGQYHFMPIEVVSTPYTKVEYLLFALLGLICGLAGLGYLKMHQAWFLFAKPYMIKHPVAIAAAVGGFTALMLFATGAYSERGVNAAVILRDCFEDGRLSQMQAYYNGVAPAGGLIASLLIRTILTPLGTTLRISVGILMCLLTIGGLMGRLFGLIVQAAAPVGSSIYLPGYAMVGAVAFASATTHTISAAVIVVEMTGEIDMLLPCLIAAVIANGVAKSRSLSLYDQGMVNKGLESFELLMQNVSGFQYAGDLIDKRSGSITNVCTVGELYKLLCDYNQQVYAVVDQEDTKHLIGSLERRYVFAFLKLRFEEQNMEQLLRATLPVDSKIQDRREERKRKLDARQAWLAKASLASPADDLDPETQYQDHHIRKGLFPSPYQFRFANTDEEGNPVTVRTKLKRVYTAIHDQFDRVSHMVSPGTPSKEAQQPPTPTEGKTFRPFSGQRLFGGPSQSAAPPTRPRASTDIREFLLQCAVQITDEKELPVNRSPFTTHRSATLDQLYILFEMVKVNAVFVVNEERVLEGVISKDNLLQSLRKKVT